VWDYRRVLPGTVEDGSTDDGEIARRMESLSAPVRAHAQECGVGFHLELSPDLKHFRFDAAPLQQALLDMADEALRGIALGRIEAREILACIGVTPEREIEVCLDLQR
jgi:hypothetical protein